jgi:hypothetical protein
MSPSPKSSTTTTITCGWLADKAALLEGAAWVESCAETPLDLPMTDRPRINSRMTSPRWRVRSIGVAARLRHESTRFEFEKLTPTPAIFL